MNRTLTLLGVLLSLCASCGGGSNEAANPEHPVAEPEPLAGAELLPEDVFLVLKVDFVRLRESSNWDVIETILMSVEENAAQAIPALGNGELRRWVSLSDRAHVGLAASNGPEPDTLVVVEGRFSTQEATTALGGFEGAPTNLRAQPGAGLPTFVTDTPPAEVVVVQNGLGVGATSGRASEMVQKHESRSGRGPFEAQPEMAAVANRVNFERDAIGVAAVFTPEAKAAFGPRLDARARAVLDVAEAGALRIGLQEGVDALAIVTTTDPAVAQQTVAELERQRANLSRIPFVGLLGLDPILDGIGTSADGGDIRLSLRASHEDTRNILGRASGFVALGIGELLEGAGAPR
jgi:hypothetical protein